MSQTEKRKGAGEEWGGGEYRSIFREIFVDLQRHYRCDARSRQPVSPGIWRRRKRAVNPLFTQHANQRKKVALRSAMSYDTDVSAHRDIS